MIRFEISPERESQNAPAPSVNIELETTYFVDSTSSLGQESSDSCDAVYDHVQLNNCADFVKVTVEYILVGASHYTFFQAI